MASQQKVEWAKLKTGILATVAMVIAAVLIFLLTGNGTLFEKQALLKTFMVDSAGMAENAPVRLNGILVGHIKQVMLSGSTVPRRTVEVDLVMPEKYAWLRFPINLRKRPSAPRTCWAISTSTSPAEPTRSTWRMAASSPRSRPRMFPKSSPRVRVCSPSFKPSSAGSTGCSPWSKTARAISANYSKTIHFMTA